MSLPASAANDNPGRIGRKQRGNRLTDLLWKAVIKTEAVTVTSIHSFIHSCLFAQTQYKMQQNHERHAGQKGHTRLL